MSEQPIFGITNIPQDIKLELNNGTLTLKSGSILTAPDGTQAQTTQNQTFTMPGSSSFQGLLFVDKATGAIQTVRDTTLVGSGPVIPVDGSTYRNFLNTSDAKFYRWDGTTWTVWGVALPIALCTVTSGVITSIDQVFNGFGYIGSSLFVLPGVEGFYPNGKDGFKNLFQTVKVNNLIIRTLSARYNNPIAFRSNAISIQAKLPTVVDKLPPIEDMTLNELYYSKFDNKVLFTSNGTTISLFNNVFFAYLTTTATSPYRVTTLAVVNPFLTVSFHDVSEYAKYLANLLIIQYNNKPKAKATIESIGAMFPDELILSVRDGFNLETAEGKQLDILSKYIGASRGYTDSNNQKAILTDDEFRILLKLKIIVNNGTGTLYGLETNLYNLFGTGIRVVEGKDSGGNPNMTLTYYIRSDRANIGLAAVQQNILPHPTGVGYSYSLAALVKYFGFIEYTDQSHPFTTGFRDYSDPTKDGEMYTYDKVIQQ